MNSARVKRQNALAALKARREGGTGAGVKTYKRESDSESENDIYDEVTEEEYKSIVRGRMMEDNFIEDDDGSGYVDDGRDEWNDVSRRNDGEDEDSEDENDYFERTGRKKKKKRAGQSTRKTEIHGKVGQVDASLRAGMPSAYSKKKTDGMPLASSRTSNVMDAYRPAVKAEKEDDFMKRLMGGLGNSDTSNIDSPSPINRFSHVTTQARKRKQDITASNITPFNRLRHSPNSPPSSDPLDPPSDGIYPDVHIAGSDTPPWGREKDSLDDEGDVPTAKRLRSASKKLDNLGIRGSEDDSEDHELNHRRSRSQSRMDPSLLAALNADMDLDDDLEDQFGFSIRAPNAIAVTAAQPVRINASSIRSRPNVQSSIKIKEEQEDIKPIISTSSPSSKQQEKPVPVLKDTWREIGAKLANVENAPTTSADSKSDASSLSSTSKVNPYEPNSRHVRFFWCDYTEQQGVIYLIGKVKDQKSGKFVSGCLQVEGVERCVYLMPKEGATEDDVYDEFDEIRGNHGIKSFLSKWVPRKYAFEIPDVPAEGNYLKIKYGFDEPQLPLDLKGRTFTRIFGANTSAFELFVVKRRIMGPCWLDVESVDLRDSSATPLSWCKVEMSVDDAKFVKPFSDSDQTAPREVPPLTVMSLSLRTVVNHKENKREIVAAAARTWKDVQIEDPTPPEDMQSSLFSVVRPLGDQFPANFEREAKLGKTKITTVKYERMLLNTLLAQIQQQDPDVIIGHEFSGVTLDILLHRMRDLRADHWSRIGRLRRQKMPILKQGFNLRVTSGRLICDLASDTARGMITSTTWSLTEMCASHLKVQREDIDPDDTASFFDSLSPTPERLISFVRHNDVDAFFQMALACKVQILGLTKQLTNLAGNSWSRTLNGGRAERNEFILLHEFHRQKYICPDKLNKSEREQLARQQQRQQEDDDDDAEGKNTNGKKDKYKGGLVFDPKRGLWDRYILVMDFNSLYPSLIQEFNIDFTTVDRKDCNGKPDEVDKMPEIPSSDVGQGVLPRLISTLVQRRRQVKGLMKDRSAAPSKQLQWNIKQLALKLTANSMYGCLGFEGSRFYARPLAALTTFKGREVLTSTKELAESLGLDVIYGDTDSVMINTNVLDLEEAKRIGVEFKKAVNERYRLLEIDIDGIFERMLLLQKKKYAAVTVADDGKRTTEIKGLDMKRREYCALSKNVSNYVLEQILSGQSTETVVEQIHEYLETVAQNMEKIPLEDFIIYKRLSKKVSEYNEQSAKSLPHVQVAKRMQAKGISVRMGDVIPYVFCLGEDGVGSTKAAQAERAYHPDDIRRKDANLTIDLQYYLSLQILPPIERLCDSIVGTDRGRLAEHLGLDASKYQSSSNHSSSSDDRQFVTLDSQTPDEVRFAQCEPLMITCPACKEDVQFTGIPGLVQSNLKPSMIKAEDDKTAISASRLLTPIGVACPQCDRRWGTPFLAIQLETAIRRYISQYYQAWNICTDSTCATQTRLQGIFARRCLTSSCHGKMTVQYGDKALYDQLCYFESLFDGEKALERARSTLQSALSSSNSNEDQQKNPIVTNASKQVEILQSRWLMGSPSRTALQALHSCVIKYTAHSGRRFVALDNLFGWMKVEE